MLQIWITGRGSRRRHEHLGRAPVRAAERSQGIDRDRERSVLDLVRAFGLGLVDRHTQQDHSIAGRQRRDHHSVLGAQVRHESAQGIAHPLRMPHQAANHAEGEDCGAQAPEMQAVRADHAQGEHPSQSSM